MAEIAWSVNLIQYSEFKIRATPEELGLKPSDGPYEYAHAYAVWCNLAMQGFEAGKMVDVVGGSGDSQPDPMELASRNLSAAPMESPQEMTEEKVREILESGVGPTTELSREPWKQEVTASKKPWEDNNNDDDLF